MLKFTACPMGTVVSTFKTENLQESFECMAKMFSNMEN